MFRASWSVPDVVHKSWVILPWTVCTSQWLMVESGLSEELDLPICISSDDSHNHCRLIRNPHPVDFGDKPLFFLLTLAVNCRGEYSAVVSTLPWWVLCRGEYSAVVSTLPWWVLCRAPSHHWPRLDDLRFFFFFLFLLILNQRWTRFPL